MELDDVLDDKVEEAVADEVKEEPVETVKSTKAQFRAKEQAAQEAGREPEVEVKPEVKPDPPAQEMTAKEKAAFSKASDEAHKRQTVEAENAELRRQLAARTAAPAAPVEAKQFWDDPEGNMNKFRDDMQNVALNTRVGTAEMIARSKYADFQEKLDIFSQIVTKTPGLGQQALASQDPAEFAYRVGKNYKDLQDAGNIDTLRSKIEKETRIKIEQELKDKNEAALKERASIPKSLSEAHGVQQNKVVWAGPTPLDNILSDK